MYQGLICLTVKRSAHVRIMVTIIFHYVLLWQRKCCYILLHGSSFSPFFHWAYTMRANVTLHHAAQTQHSYKLQCFVRRELFTHQSNHSNVKLSPLYSRVETNGCVVMLMHVNQLLAWTKSYRVTFQISAQKQTCKCFFYCHGGNLYMNAQTQLWVV